MRGLVSCLGHYDLFRLRSVNILRWNSSFRCACVSKAFSSYKHMRNTSESKANFIGRKIKQYDSGSAVIASHYAAVFGLGQLHFLRLRQQLTTSVPYYVSCGP